MNRLKNASIAATAGAAFSAPTFADVPTEVTTAMTTLGTDIATVGGLLIVAAVTAMTFKWLKAMFF